MKPAYNWWKDIGIYDIDEVQSEFVDDLSDVRDIHLLVEGIHCAACVWLIEHTLGPLPGVLNASVNLSARRVHLRWEAYNLDIGGHE